MSHEIMLLQQASDKFAMHYVVTAKAIVEHLHKCGYEVVHDEIDPSTENVSDCYVRVSVKSKNTSEPILVGMFQVWELFETIRSTNFKILLLSENAMFNQMLKRKAIKTAYNHLVKSNQISPIQINKL